MKLFLSLIALVSFVSAAHAEETLAEKAEAVATQLRNGLSEDVPVDPQDLFNHVFSTPTPQLKEQSALLADELARDASAGASSDTEAAR